MNIIAGEQSLRRGVDASPPNITCQLFEIETRTFSKDFIFFLIPLTTIKRIRKIGSILYDAMFFYGYKRAILLWRERVCEVITHSVGKKKCTQARPETDEQSREVYLKWKATYEWPPVHGSSFADKIREY